MILYGAVMSACALSAVRGLHMDVQHHQRASDDQMHPGARRCVHASV